MQAILGLIIFAFFVEFAIGAIVGLFERKSK